MAGCAVDGVHDHAAVGVASRAIADGRAADSTVSGLAASGAAGVGAAANGLASALARGGVSAIGEEGRAANGAMFPAGFTSAMPCGTRADAVRSIAEAGCAVTVSSVSSDADGLPAAMS